MIAKRSKAIASKNKWEKKFLAKIQNIHKIKKEEVVKKILIRIDRTKNGLVYRSKKHNVECNITVEELRELMYLMYGRKCKYCDKQLILKNLQIDHIIPISKQGYSSISNLQIICKMCNKIKGSLPEDRFYILLDWLKTIPEDLRNDLRIRLARGFH